MTRRLIIHVGPGKTGTSAFQKACAADRAGLADRGVLYPDLGATAHHPVANGISLDIGYKANLNPFEKLLEQAEARPHDVLLLSSEGFTRALFQTSRFLENYCRFWEARDYAVELVCAVRPREEALESQYCQRVKILNQGMRFGPWVRDSLRELPPYLRFWKDPPRALSRRAVTFIPYDAAMKANAAAAIFSAMGLAGREPAGGTGRINPHPGWRRVEACLRLTRARFRRVGPVAPGLAKWDWGRIEPMLKIVTRAAKKQGWEDEPFHGLTPEIRALAEERLGETQEAFAQAQWGRSWRDVFGAPAPLPPANEFDPRNADPEDNDAIQAVVRDALRAKPERNEKALSNRHARWPLGPGNSST